ncbi:LysM peptidoglycan-binding domain-containing protein [Desulfobacter postgatei]|uniref:Soluble lytic murein transglycosylase-like protein n=1 Tax=Desulfobacter postgatei 2ac9 TaxID=879212 RepID=I5B483_9BACT|nr:LysM peptidoglycan-binding domain-containing protein [Desulfobacter postgatei]EIM64296.1 soluble lytic murein transglycosylase-like protein [Desulfobacter postgatei 2ac9]
MNTHKLAALIFLLFLITGCQQSHLSANNPITDQTFKMGDDQDQATLQDETEDRNQAPNSDQGKIDQALELASEAQNYWEEDNLEEALSSLDAAYALILEIETTDNSEFDQQKEDIRYLISKRILEIYASRQIVVTGHHEAIPITLNDHVNAEIKCLTGPERNFFIRSLSRSYRYRPFIVQELKKAGLPEEISWLPLIESGFNSRALSPARALGMWQFIPSTGNKFGLTRNHYIDERMDPEKATRAAIDYLKELHNLFGDWTTAIAAYNCGEYRVLKTIRQQKLNYLDNFWDLYQSLPRETARYVPRFLATVHIVNNLEKYNIVIDTPPTPLEYKTFDIKKQIRLSDIAKAINVDTDTLVSLNSELRHKILPPETYTIKIPIAHADQFMTKIDEIKTTYQKTPQPQPQPQYKYKYTYYRVRKGDTLSGIADKHKTSVSTLASCNNISEKSRIATGKVLKIPGSKHQARAKTASGTKKGKGSKQITYTVRRGDNLWMIAQKFSTTTTQIKALNKLSGSRLSSGQRLRIVTGGTENSKTLSKYQVKSGDSPLCIAKRHNMSLDRLLSLNNLSTRSKIYPGQNLLVE